MRLDYFMLSGGLHRRVARCVQATDGLAEAGLWVSGAEGLR